MPAYMCMFHVVMTTAINASSPWLLGSSHKGIAHKHLGPALTSGSYQARWLGELIMQKLPRAESIGALLSHSNLALNQASLQTWSIAQDLLNSKLKAEA